MTIKIRSYNNGSQGAHLLAEELGVFLLKHEGSRWRPRPQDWVVNWGKGANYNCYVLNRPEHVNFVLDKLKFFNRAKLLNISTPAWTTSKEEVRRDIHASEGKAKWLARTILNGHEGAGIVVCDNHLDIVDAPLYTKYIPKKHEYRVHVFAGRVIQAAKKVLKKSVDPKTANFTVRNSANGFVFQKNGFELPDSVSSLAINAVQAFSLDFGACDIIVGKNGSAILLEINTAPGIEGSTVKAYAEAIKGHCR